MDYRTEINKMLTEIQNPQVLRYIWIIVKGIVLEIEGGVNKQNKKEPPKDGSRILIDGKVIC